MSKALRLTTCTSYSVGKVNQRMLLVQTVYPPTSRLVSWRVLDKCTNVEKATHAALVRQAIAFLRWAHKFGPNEDVHNAERFLRERVPLMLTVRAWPANHLRKQALHKLS